MKWIIDATNDQIASYLPDLISTGISDSEAVVESGIEEALSFNDSQKSGPPVRQQHRP